MNEHSPRRKFITNSTLGAFGLFAVPGLASPRTRELHKWQSTEPDLPMEFPSQERAAVKAVVGAAHTQYDKVKELVTSRPELAKAAYDWGFGDWESALGAASHMGRVDIAQLLMDHGARPNIYTFAMMGKLKAVRSMVEEMPGIQRIPGPHGMTLLFHAQNRLRYKDLSSVDRAAVESVVHYLEGLGDADPRATSLDITPEEQKTYMGKYVFGPGPEDFFVVELNRRGSLYMSRGEQIGRTLLRVADHAFAPGWGTLGPH